MNYRQLGRSSLQVSSIGFGCMSLGNSMSLGEEREAARLIHRSVEMGINFFDTADLYDKGLNEERVGRILRDRRADVLLATKVGNQWREDGSGWDWNPRKEYIIKAVEGSLRRLQTDRIDLYQLHGGTMEDPFDETIEAFELLRQQGKIRYYGLSSIRPNVIREYVRRSGGGDRSANGGGIMTEGESMSKDGIVSEGESMGGGAIVSGGESKSKNESGSGIVSVMLQYSLLDRRPEEGCLEFLRNAGVGVLARGALGKGLLAGKAAVPYLDRTAEEVERAAGAVRTIAGQEHTMADIAIRYVLEEKAVTSAIVGVRTDDQLTEIMAGKGEGGLDNAGLGKLREALPPNRYDTHR